MGWVSMQEDILERCKSGLDSIKYDIGQTNISYSPERLLKKSKKILAEVENRLNLIKQIEAEQPSAKLNEEDYLGYKALQSEHAQLSEEFAEIVKVKEYLKYEVQKLKTEAEKKFRLVEQCKEKDNLIARLKTEIRRLKKEKLEDEKTKSTQENKKLRLNNHNNFSKLNSKKFNTKNKPTQRRAILNTKPQKNIKCEYCNVLFSETAITQHKQGCLKAMHLKQILFSKCVWCGDLFRKSYIQQHENSKCAKRPVI